MDIKLKSTKLKTNISYILLVVFISIFLLSLIEVKDNLRFLVPDRLYTETYLRDEINTYESLIRDYSLYYKSSVYSGKKENITSNDISICKAELIDKANSEYQEFMNEKYSDYDFNNLTYEQQEKILSEGKNEINKKYSLSDSELESYVVRRKSNSESRVINDINSYVNLKFSAYDKGNSINIGEKVDDIEETINSSRYFKEINIKYNGTIIENEYVDGKEINWNSTLNKIIDFLGTRYYYDYGYKYNGTWSYNIESTQSMEYQDYQSSDKQNITIYMWIPNDIESGDVIYSSFSDIYRNIKILCVSMVICVLSLILCVIAYIYILRKKEKSKELEFLINKLKYFPIELKVVVILLAGLFLYEQFNYWYSINGYLKSLTLLRIGWLSLLLSIIYIVLIAVYRNFKEGTLIKNNVTKKVCEYLHDVMSRGSIVRTFAIMTLLYVACGLALFFISAFFYIWPIGLLVGIVLTIIYIIMFIKDLIYLDKVMVGAKEASEGKLNYKIVEKGRGHIRELAHDINNIKDGLKDSIQKEVKSENMKTELITNVSHDLKTPLTSIINYIDLLKREDIKPENAKDYVEILDRKSQRLKILIEDLFEASKAASGAMELNISKIDVGQLLNQVLGENDERFNESNLRIKITMPEDKIYIDADGKRMYRVFENLLSNIIKYSLSNTRVFIDMYKEENEVYIIMKNISAYELDFDADDITNRFKRGDSSRTTDGSGLGLAIAKSIIELHHGTFKIEVDGDMFKSIIKLEAY